MALFQFLDMFGPIPPDECAKVGALDGLPLAQVFPCGVALKAFLRAASRIEAVLQGFDIALDAGQFPIADEALALGLLLASQPLYLFPRFKEEHMLELAQFCTVPCGEFARLSLFAGGQRRRNGGRELRRARILLLRIRCLALRLRRRRT